MYEVPERRHLNSSVGVIGENGHACRGTPCAHDPIVASLRRDLARGHLRCLHARHQAAIGLDHLQRGQPSRRKRVSVPCAHRVEEVLGDDADVETCGNLEVVPRVRGGASIRLLGAVACNVHRELDLVDGMSPHAGDGQRSPAQNDRLGSP